MVTENERDYLWNFYAADRRMRLNLGIRRRLAPLMENDRRKIELMNSAAVVDAGHAGRLLRRRDRHGRQHLPRRSRRRAHADAMVARPQRRLLARRSAAALPAADHGRDLRLRGGQRRGPAARARVPAQLDEADDRGPPGARRRSAAAPCACSTRATARSWPICASTRASASSASPTSPRSAQAVELDLSAFKACVPVELLGRSPFPPIGDLPYLLTLPGHGFYWFLLAEAADLPRWHEPIPEPLPDFITLVLRDGWRAVLEGRGGRELERQVLPAFLVNQRWFGAKDRAITGTPGRGLGRARRRPRRPPAGRDRGRARRRRAAAALLPAARDQLRRPDPEPRLAAAARSRSPRCAAAPRWARSTTPWPAPSFRSPPSRRSARGR